MALGDHLRELRGRLAKAALAVVLGTCVTWAFYTKIITELTRPFCNLRLDQSFANGCNLTVTGLLTPFNLQLQVSVTAGIVATVPFWMYQIWAFVLPGLHKKEKRYTVGFLIFAVPLFLAGAFMAYTILPKGLQILLSFVPPVATPLIQLDSYLTFLLRMVLVFGGAFVLPVVLVMLNMLGVLSARRLASGWRLAIFVITLFSAIVTPSPDPFTMLILASPLYLLYFLAVLIAYVVDRRRGKIGGEDDFRRYDDDEISALTVTHESSDQVPSDLDDDEPTRKGGRSGGRRGDTSTKRRRRTRSLTARRRAQAAEKSAAEKARAATKAPGAAPMPVPEPVGASVGSGDPFAGAMAGGGFSAGPTFPPPSPPRPTEPSKASLQMRSAPRPGMPAQPVSAPPTWFTAPVDLRGLDETT